MIRTVKGSVRIVLVAAIIGVAAACALPAWAAEPNVLSYPNSSAVFQYDPARYVLLAPGDPDYDPSWALAGRVLWDTVDERIPVEIYRAPQLVGFEPSAQWRNEYVTLRNQFDLTVDGFYAQPRFLGNLMVRFVPDPATATAVISVDGVPLDGYVYPLGNLNVATPVTDGYADTLVRTISWTGGLSLRMVVFADRNLNGVFDDGPPLYTVRAQDNPIPVEATSWGRVKSLYGE
jgi:hypothetical protein